MIQVRFKTNSYFPHHSSLPSFSCVSEYCGSLFFDMNLFVYCISLLSFYMYMYIYIYILSFFLHLKLKKKTTCAYEYKIYRSLIPFSKAVGLAPMILPMSWPSLPRTKVGIAVTSHSLAISGDSSTSHLTNLTSG